MQRFFSADMPGLLFLRNVLIFSVGALVPVLFLYVVLSPGFAPALLEVGPGLQRFLRQVGTNGLPVVFGINYVGFFLFALVHRATGNERDPARYILIDMAARICLFFALHAVIYMFAADWYGSFGGDRTTALSVVAPTLARSAFFENISGVYLYATLVSAMPLYVSVAKKSHILNPLVQLFPKKLGPPAIAALSFLGVLVFLTTIANIIVSLQGR